MSGGCGGHGGGPTLPPRRASGQTVPYQPGSHAANPALEAVLGTVLVLVTCAPLLIGLFIVLHLTGII